MSERAGDRKKKNCRFLIDDINLLLGRRLTEHYRQWMFIRMEGESPRDNNSRISEYHSEHYYSSYQLTKWLLSIDKFSHSVIPSSHSVIAGQEMK